jgi:group I intron endonuclease
MANKKIFRFNLNEDNYKKSGIYRIINIDNGKFYIGSAENFSTRFNRHYNELIRDKHSNKHLQNSWNLNGEDKFIFEIIEICEKSKLLKREQDYLDHFKPYDKKIGYNICMTSTSRLGVKENPQITEKRREIQKEVMSRPDVIEKIRMTNSTDESKIKRSLASKGRKWSEESRRMFSSKKKEILKNSGGYSQETKNRMSDAKKGKIPSNTRRITQYSLEGQKIADFESIADAVRHLENSGIKISASKISLCITGKRNKAGGFIWKSF